MGCSRHGRAPPGRLPRPRRQWLTGSCTSARLQHWEGWKPVRIQRFVGAAAVVRDPQRSCRLVPGLGRRRLCRLAERRCRERVPVAVRTDGGFARPRCGTAQPRTPCIHRRRCRMGSCTSARSTTACTRSRSALRHGRRPFARTVEEDHRQRHPLSSPSVANGVVYVGSNDGKLYAFAVGCGTGGATCNGVDREHRARSIRHRRSPTGWSMSVRATTRGVRIRRRLRLRRATCSRPGRQRRETRSSPLPRSPTGSCTSAPTTTSPPAFAAGCATTVTTCTPLWRGHHWRRRRTPRGCQRGRARRLPRPQGVRVWGRLRHRRRTCPPLWQATTGGAVEILAGSRQRRAVCGLSGWVPALVLDLKTAITASSRRPSAPKPAPEPAATAPARRSERAPPARPLNLRQRGASMIGVRRCVICAAVGAGLTFGAAPASQAGPRSQELSSDAASGRPPSEYVCVLALDAQGDAVADRDKQRGELFPIWPGRRKLQG